VQRIFVGDVQGCADELGDLLERARAAFGGDFELWLVGDLVNRGPASLRVLQTVRALCDAGRARFVLGNHELSLLRRSFGLRGREDGDTFEDVLEAGGDWLDWLRRQPVLVADRLGDERFALVHASVPPRAELAALRERAARIEARLADSTREARRLLGADRDDEDADLLAQVTRCRSVDARGRWWAREPKDARDAWHARWSASSPHYGVVYGHWATQGLHVAAGLRGLDTGCVYHGAWGDRFLTAWLPKPEDRQPFRAPDDRFWHVPARARYVREPR
jgi:bis(5'-nucleosyl)-tetraphosphatase (symmetrical)